MQKLTKSQNLTITPIRVVNTPLIPTSYAELAAWLYANAGESPLRTFDFTNTHIVALRALDPMFHELTDTIDYFVPDSMPLTWCVNLLGGQMKDRVYGPAFMSHCLQHSPEQIRHFFLGGSEDCLHLLVKQVRLKNPSLQIVGTHHGYFEKGDEGRIIEMINASTPDCIWIGLGTPKQQEFLARNRHLFCGGNVLLVGFAFDVNAGTKRDAPPFLQRMGLTWLFRIINEPRRLLPRYLKYNTLYILFFIESVLLTISLRAVKPALLFFFLTYIIGGVSGTFQNWSLIEWLIWMGGGPLCLLGALITTILTMTIFDLLDKYEQVSKSLFFFNAFLSGFTAIISPLVIFGVLTLSSPHSMATLIGLLLAGTWGGMTLILLLLAFTSILFSIFSILKRPKVIN